jgi:hypothetical protein
MRTRTLAIAAVASFALSASPAFAELQQKKQTSTLTSIVSVAVPLTLWAVTSSVVAVVGWPIVASGGAVGFTPITSVAAFETTTSAVGAVVGGVGYLLTR